MSITQSMVLWTLAGYYTIFVVLGILRDILRFGYKVFQWKQVARPSCLDDATLGSHGYLPLEDVRIHYVASGPEDKPLMLFLHGFPEFWFSWRHQIREFQKDYRVVAIDMRGYGESEKPGGKLAYSRKKLASDVKQVITALGYKSCVLVANDWGGIIAWYFGRHFADMVDRLIIFNVPPRPVVQKILRVSRKQLSLSWYTLFFQLPYLPELFFKSKNFDVLETMFGQNGTSRLRFSLEPFKTPFSQEEVDAYKYTFSQPGAVTPPINYYRCVYNYDPSDIYDMDYTMPVLVVWGVKDACVNPMAVDMIEKDYPKITVKRIGHFHEAECPIPEAGHFVHMETPDLVNSAMREWLDEQKKVMRRKKTLDYLLYMK